MSELPNPLPDLNNEPKPQDGADEAHNNQGQASPGRKMSKLKSVSKPVEQEDILAETRMELLQEEHKKNSGFFARAKRKLKKSPAAGTSEKQEKGNIEEGSSLASEDLEGMDAAGQVEEQLVLPGEGAEPDQAATEPDTEAILEMIKHAEELAEEGEEKNLVVAEPPQVQEGNGDKLQVGEAARGQSRQAIKLRPQESAPIEDAALRDMALQDYVEPPKEKARVRRDSIFDKIEDATSDKKNAAVVRFVSLAILALVAMVALVVIAFSIPRPAREDVPVDATITTVTPLPPYPIQVRLPGGWAFLLNRGMVQDNKWVPQGAEWLEGTEICKWIALPWSEQLEAVFNTLKPGDPIELVMSNYDRWLYKVRSYQVVDITQMSSLDRSTPSVLLILIKSGSNSRYVIVATP